jgi:hypothetical protein
MIDSDGYTLMQDNIGLREFLTSQPDLVLFGGFVKHLLQPAVHHHYADIDVIALNQGAMQRLENLFDYRFQEVSASTSYPRYFIGKPSKAGKTLQVILLRSMPDALAFVHQAQFNGDRVALSNSQYYFDEAVGEKGIRQAISTKVMKRVPTEKRFWLFHADRERTENKHHFKLLKKGFRIVE